MAEEIHVGDVGTSIEITLMDGDVILPDLDQATGMEMVFRKPDDSRVVMTASFLTDGTDGIIHYLTEAGDLDQSGSWKVQAKVALPAGEWSSTIGKFKVYDNL